MAVIEGSYNFGFAEELGIEEGGGGDGREKMVGRIQSKTRNAHFPTYSPIPSGPIAS